VPAWLPESWLLTVGWSPLYQELTRVPLIVHAPGLTPGYRQALTTAPDLAPTILELAGIEHPSVMQGESFLDVIVGSKEERRLFVLSSWPLYFAEGEITTDVDFRPRRISSYMPITITARDRSVILGGPEDPPELYDLTEDSRERENVWEPRAGEGKSLCEGVISFLEEQGMPEDLLAPRRKAVEGFVPGR
jgi:arylsulfatase A-like enzyme